MITDPTDIRPNECRILALILRGMSGGILPIDQQKGSWESMPSADRERWCLFAARAWGVCQRLLSERQPYYTDAELIAKEAKDG